MATKRLVTSAEWKALGESERAETLVRAEGTAEPVSPDSEAVTFVISTADVDRAGDTIAVKGWDTTEFERNPVVLWAHDHRAMPVGKAARVYVDGNALKADVVFAPAEVNPLGPQVAAAVKGGFLSAVSVGFRPTKWQFNEDRPGQFGMPGADFEEQELEEFSVVPVPCNPNALLEGKAAGVDLSFLRDWAEQTLDKTAAPSGPAKESTVKTLVFHVQVDEKSADKVQKAIENQIKVAGGASASVRVEKDGNAAEMTEALKGLKDLSAEMKSMHKDYAALHGEMTKTHKDLATHTDKMGQHCADLGGYVKTLKDTADGDGPDGDEDEDDKSAPDAVTKGGAPHKLSAKNLKSLKSAMTAVSKAAGHLDDMNKAHEGVADSGSADEQTTEDETGKAAREAEEKAALEKLAALEADLDQKITALTGKVA
jgi:HK97 family phage prohead protease